jgi:hypothetical protein
MVEGRLVASGSSSSLKAQYGCGYTLRIMLQRQQQQQQQQQRVHADYDGGCKAAAAAAGTGPVQRQQQHAKAAAAAEKKMTAAAAALVQLVQLRIPAAVLLDAAGAELSFRIPQAAREAAAALLDTIAASRQELGVASYAFSVTTLQEVRPWCCRVGHTAFI